MTDLTYVVLPVHEDGSYGSLDELYGHLVSMSGAVDLAVRATQERAGSWIAKPFTADLLTGRMATCPDCRREEPSSPNLAFFTYRGPGSEFARRCAHPIVRNGETYFCGLRGEVAHQPGRTGFGHDFVEGNLPANTDSFYCGCKGWD